MENKGVVLIPFRNKYDIKNFSLQYNINKYTGMYLPKRDKEHPSKFIIIIEEWDYKDIPKDLRKMFYQQKRSGYYFKNENDLKNFQNRFYSSSMYITRKLIDEGYIYISIDINEPMLIII